MKTFAANVHTLKKSDAVELIDKLVDKIEKLIADAFKKTDLMEQRTRAEQIINSNDSKLIIDEIQIKTLYLLDEPIFYSETSLAHACLALMLEEMSNAGKFSPACNQQLLNGIGCLKQLKDLRLSFYSFHFLTNYLETLLDTNVDQIVQTDCCFIDLMFKVFSINSSEKAKYIESVIVALDNSNITKYFSQLDFILPLLSSKALDRDKIKNALLKLANNPGEFSARICFILLTFYHKHTNFKNKKLNLFMKRILKSFGESEKIVLVKFYFECDEHIEKNNSIQNLSSIKNYLCDILSTHELAFLKYMDPNLLVKDILEKHFDYIWIEVMEGMFISLMSNKILANEQNVLLEEIQNLEEDSHSLESKLKQLVDCSYFTQCDLDFNFLKSKKINYRVLNSIKNFKINLILSNEIFVDKQIWIEFINGLARSNIDLSVTTKLLSFSRYFHPIEEHFNELLNNCESKYLISYFLLESVKNLFSTILSHSSTNFELDLAAVCDCLESNFLKGDSDNDYYLEWLASKLLNEVNKKTKLQISEIEAIKNMLHNSFCLGINQSGGQAFLNRLDKLAILKWNDLIKIELIKKELNRPECDKLAKDIVYLEDVRGTNLVTELMTVLKSVPLDQFTLSTIIEKFKKNEWDLNFKIVKLMKDTTSSDWIKKISEHDQNEKKKEMSVQELIVLMRQKEAPNEANYNVRDLICVNRESNQCLLEQCLYEIEEKQKLKSVIDIDIEKSIVEYDELDVKKWTNTYKLLSKVNVDSILCNEVVELCCVLSRGSKLTFGYELRSTQLIALILFIDAMLKKRGRLANISTGEGKSVITIVTAIAHLLVRGGTVDILTSSELLAERDAIESEHFFKLFSLNVSNNCDLDASQYEHVRQNRYQNNQVIYGVIGNFQRDLLLTKYYAKPIRKELATCLIVDEVDSMCIDNMCNTLYISHQIADLKYLKDVYMYIWQAVNMFDTAEYTVKNVEKIKSFIELKIKESQIVYPASLQEMIERKIKIWIENAYLAKTTIQEGDQYSIISKGRQSGQAVINDLQTGIEQLNTQWSDGLQQFIQLKHYNKLSEESLKSIFMSNYIFFKQYNDNIFGMTGTLGASQERDLLSNAYGLDFFHLPRFKRELNVRHNDFVLATRSAWLAQIKQSVDSYLANNRIIEKKEIDDSKSTLQSVLDEKALLDHNIENLTIMLNEAKLAEIDESQLSQREKEAKCQGLQTELNNLIKLKDDYDLCIESLRDVLGEDMSRNSGGRAVLVICKNKKDVNDVVRNLLVNHKHLFDFNGKLDGLRKVDGLSKRAATEIRQLRPGDVVVATNVAGRGTDFKLSDLLLKNGGLHVILSYVPDNERVELQAFGRSGRKGQPGSGNLIVYDKRLFSNHELTVDLLKQERDADEEERLMEIRIKMIPRVIIEKKLFEKFEMLQDRIKEYIYTKFQDRKFNELMIKSLHNKWAFWLEKMSSLINNVYRSNENEEEIFDCFDNFAAKIVKECHRDINGIQGLIDEPSELIKLA
ncbi:pre translocase subunit, partial [Brachionus plicatilis]